MAVSKFDLPEAIIIGGFAVFADICSIIPGVGTLFILTAYAGFQLAGISAPFPAGSMFAKLIPLASFLYPACTIYIWRVYQRNKPGGVLSAITSAVPNPAASVASVVPNNILPGPGSAGLAAAPVKTAEKRKAA